MPTISVIIPVRNGADHLEHCLGALEQSTPKPLECIVVDDGSQDRSAAVALEHGARIIRLDRRSGPAHARNVGASAARGDVLFFIDADVCVHPDTLERIDAAFGSSPDLHGLIGSYDDAPAAGDFLSQYKNLMHCFIHQRSHKVASTFWSGCGAIRRELFLSAGGFDESYRRPSIEDIELGYRLHSAGKKVLLDPKLLVTHRKRWKFWNLLETDILYRAIPWTRLILRDRRLPDDLNLSRRHRLSALLSYALVGTVAVGSILLQDTFYTPVAALFLFLTHAYWVDAARRRFFAPLALTAHAAFTALVAFLAWSEGMPWIVALALIGITPVILSRLRFDMLLPPKFWAAASAVYVACCAVVSVLSFPRHPVSLVFAALLFAVVLLNGDFYRFIASRRGITAAAGAVPFHLSYYLYSGMAFACGLLLHLKSRDHHAAEAGAK